jgi:hypothetical protein
LFSWKTLGQLGSESLQLSDSVEGLTYSRRARWKYGLYSAEALAEHQRVRELLTQSRELLKQMQVG